MSWSRSIRLRLALTVGSLGLVLLAVAGYAVVTIVDHNMHDNARAEAIRALNTARATNAPGTVASQDPDAPPVQMGGGPTGSQFVDPVLSRLDFSGVPVDELYLTRQVVFGDAYYIAVLKLSRPRPRVLATVAPLGDIERTVRALRTGVAVAVPVLAGLLAAMAAFVAGRSLRPVAVMRAEADRISHGTLDYRLGSDAGAGELTALAGTINAMLERLESAAKAQRQFTSDASHELRSPLTTIRAQLELALQAPDTLTRRGAIMLGDIDRLDTIVGDLLTLARAAEPAHFSIAAVDLDDIVLEHAHRLTRPGLTIDIDNVQAAQVDGDERLLTSLVRNLIDNAARHATTTVRISLASTLEAAQLVVDDDGPGIPADRRSAVFERFTRLDASRDRDSGGTGLGLAVAKAAAEAHHGTITITDAPGGGTRFVASISPCRL